MQKHKLTKSSPSVSDSVRSFTLRVDDALLQQIDKAVSQHLVINSRNTWIVNAIVEQIKREKKK